MITKNQIGSKVTGLETKFHFLLENSNDLITFLNEKFEHEFINEKAYLKILGYTSKEIIGKRLRDFVYPLDIKRGVKYIRKGLIEGEVTEEFRIKHKDGRYVLLQTKGKFYKDNYGTLKALLISRDITESKKSEQKLIESEEKYRHLYENSPIGIVVTDNEGVILEGNAVAAKIFGYEPDEAIGKNFTDLRIFSPKEISLIEKRYDATYKGVSLEPLELHIRKKDGNHVWIHYQSSVINLEDKILVESIACDITEKKLAEDLIKQENKKLIELSKMKTDLISRVSHELKTPLNSIYGGAQILLDLYKDSTSSDALEFIEMINKGGRRLKFLIENLLDTSRIESNKLNLNLQEENLVAIMKECIEDIKYMLNGRQVNLELNFTDSLYL
ncbi:MAG: PAS domain S-box protein [Candidatus Hodarchaeota archaeon]